MARGNVFITPGGLKLLQEVDGVGFARLIGGLLELQKADDRPRDPLAHLGLNSVDGRYDPRPPVFFFAPEWGDI